MKILEILCHPDYNNENRVANILAKVGNGVLTKQGEKDIKTLNLYSPCCHIPIMDKYMFNYPEEGLNYEELRDKKRQQELLNEWKEAEGVFIYMPLHNFNIVSKFKDYIDNIVIANETFKCEIETLIGLDNKDKKVVFVLTSGGEFDTHIQYTNLDFTVQYVRGILSVMGIDYLQVLRVQGLDLEKNNKEEIIEKAKVDLEKIVMSVLEKR